MSFGFNQGSVGGRFPSFTAPFTRFAFTGATPEGANGGIPQQGLIADAFFGAQALSPQQLFGGFGDALANAQQAGLGLRQLTAQATQPGFQNALGLAGLGAQTGQQIGGLANQVPNILAATFPGFNRLQEAGQGASQTLQNVLNPTANNPLFRNAFENQLAPQINASFASRGLGSSGPAVQALSEGARDLSNQFAQRQFAEQLQAAGQLGQLGQAATFAPGTVFGQLQSGLGEATQGLQGAANLQGAPLGLLGTSGEVFRQGLNLPLEFQRNLFDFTRAPQTMLLGALSGTQLSPNQRFAKQGSRS